MQRLQPSFGQRSGKLWGSTLKRGRDPKPAPSGDLAALAGVVALTARAQHHVEDGKALEAIHLLDIALGTEPKSRDALTVKNTALVHLLAASGGSKLSETMWLRSEIMAVEAALSENSF